MNCIKDEADGIFVTDTGSSDRTVEILKDNGAVVKTAIVTPWRFDIPRNISLAHVPQDYDICLSIDLDEVLTPGWAECIKTAWTKQKTTRLLYKYVWSHQPDGSDGITFWYDKCHQRRNYRWHKPVHEVLQLQNEPEHCAYVEGFELHHWPDHTKSRGSYLGLLELSVQEEPNDDRNSHYLGREYMYHGRWDDAIRELKRHLTLASATWAGERAASMRFISKCYREQRNVVEAKRWALRAIAESPIDREPLVDLAKASYEDRDFVTTYYASKKALEIKDRPKSYICEPYAWGYEPWDYLAISAYNLGHYQEALAAATEAHMLNPNDQRLAENVQAMRKKVKSTA